MVLLILGLYFAETAFNYLNDNFKMTYDYSFPVGSVQEVRLMGKHESLCEEPKNWCTPELFQLKKCVTILRDKAKISLNPIFVKIA